VPIQVDGKRFYRIGEALAAASLSRATYFRWLKLGRLRDTRFKDRNGRRIFTDSELGILVDEAKRLIEQPQLEMSFNETEKS
jgi:predicted site-specific integrase-resolvase